MMILKNAKIVLLDEIIELGWIEVEGQKITAINRGVTDLDGLDCSGLTIMPGYIDCHVHGGYGYNFEQGTIDSFVNFAKNVTKEGITRYCQGTVTGAISNLEKILTVYADFMANHNNGPQARQIGAHLEGPFISPAFKGAHEETLLLKPDVVAMKKLVQASNDNIRIVTYAPELQDGSFTKYLLDQKIVPSMGHSAATFKDVEHEVNVGANHFTHLHNGMSRYDHRNPGMINAGLYFDEILCELITDGIHNDLNVLKEVYKIKGPDHICIITDAMTAKGMPDGPYKLGELDVVKNGQTVTLLNGVLAGSAATYDYCVKNMYEVTNCSLIDLSKMTSINVAKQFGLFDQTGSITVGKFADFTIVDGQLNVKATIVEGEIAYNNL
ncbi:N-acetylglucosamine-6-phosphate deacetylase [Spiroplasma syrphidicola EA-1]|uniref:N-acetylglucosamine-6-phosphate deacetylase n=1 Tax=Spiroplasma syrphidicola EA-1 TaxID=1276229 RepID=R4U6K0_9MOLU|nr:N-acetylglucosamine-6-phosphate deacetylase [Spiroplasma syrphidicola]AGM26238.1 N-acetylglucosamine-6-phosphate deacetylase [Spiroplasma syrphidicola EA-1]